MFFLRVASGLAYAVFNRLDELSNWLFIGNDLLDVLARVLTFHNLICERTDFFSSAFNDPKILVLSSRLNHFVAKIILFISQID